MSEFILLWGEAFFRVMDKKNRTRWDVLVGHFSGAMFGLWCGWVSEFLWGGGAEPFPLSFAIQAATAVLAPD